MGTKWLIFLITLWLMLAVMGGIIEHVYVGGAESSTLNTLMGMKVLVEVNDVPLPIPNPDFFKALYTVFAFDFVMFSGGIWGLIRWLFLAISLGIVINLAYSLASLVRGGGSAST